MGKLRVAMAASGWGDYAGDLFGSDAEGYGDSVTYRSRGDAGSVPVAPINGVTRRIVRSAVPGVVVAAGPHVLPARVVSPSAPAVTGGAGTAPGAAPKASVAIVAEPAGTPAARCASLRPTQSATALQQTSIPAEPSGVWPGPREPDAPVVAAVPGRRNAPKLWWDQMLDDPGRRRADTTSNITGERSDGFQVVSRREITDRLRSAATQAQSPPATPTGMTVKGAAEAARNVAPDKQTAEDVLAGISWSGPEASRLFSSIAEDAAPEEENGDTPEDPHPASASRAGQSTIRPGRKAATPKPPLSSEDLVASPVSPAFDTCNMFDLLSTEAGRRRLECGEVLLR